MPPQPNSRDLIVGAWIPVSREPEHPLATLDGKRVPGGRLRVLLGRRSRFGARYVTMLLAENPAGDSLRPVLRGLHSSGPLPSYNWFEVAETSEAVDSSTDVLEHVLTLLLDILPPGGHLMVEYDSPQRADTARALALGVPPLATPLGELLFRIGCGAKFKDWQIAEGGSEGPRKLQAYKPLTAEDAQRWRKEAHEELRAFVEDPDSPSEVVRRAQERAVRLLPSLKESASE